MFMVDILRPRLIVEIGTREGTIYCAYAQAVRDLRLKARCFAIGNWSEVGGSDGGSSGPEQLREHHDPLYSEFSQLIPDSSGEAHTNFQNGSIDLLHITGRASSHPEQNWFEEWRSKMSDRGVIVFQNINGPGDNADVRRLWRELASVHEHFEIAHAGGLGVLAVGKQADLRPLLQMEERDRALTRELFHQLGQRLSGRGNGDHSNNSEELINSLSALASLRGEEVEAKTNELEVKKETLDSLALELANTCEELEEEKLTVHSVSTELAAKTTQLKTILNCRAWRWVTRYGHFKNRFVTPIVSRFVTVRKDENTDRMPIAHYHKWVKRYGTLSSADHQAINKRIETLEYQPLISVIMPVYDVDEKWLRRAIESVREQLYERWELCIADDYSAAPHIRVVLDEYRQKDSRIKVIYRDKNGHISAASNSALELATGEFTALLDHDDELSAHALYMVVEELNAHPEADLIFSDEDKITEEGDRFDPHFKTDWNPDLLYSMNFVSHLGVYRTSILKAIGGFREGYEGSQDYDLVLRFCEQVSEDHIRHIPYILYHWRAIATSVAANRKGKEYAFESARNAIRSHFERRGRTVTVAPGVHSYHRVIYPVPSPAPLVSFIIGTRDRVELLRQTIEGIMQTDYDPFEVIIIDNATTDPDALAYLEEIQTDARIRVVQYLAPFNFSAINNIGVREARGEIICLLNNDIKIISPGWLREMVSHALRPKVGAVGAKLYYENDTIQHAGVIIGLGGVAGHAHKHLAKRDVGYVFRTKVIQGFSAVTGACLVMRRELFLEVGGLNEVNLPIAFNDVDLCMRLRQRGYRNVWTPYAELYHLESASRGPEETLERWPVFQRECAYFRYKWSDELYTDPYYNPNLTLTAEDFSLAAPPRLARPWENPACSKSKASAVAEGSE
jgi:glycosyltransferase involved in cell wall biosynthesis